MGLLDNIFGSEEGRLGIGLLAAAMPSNVPQGQRLMGVLAQQDQAKQQALQQQLMQSQIAENAAQAKMREQQFGLAQQKQNVLAGLFGGAAPLAGVTTGGGLNMSSGGGSPSGGGLANLTIDQVAALKANGIDVYDAWKLQKEGFKREAGSYNEDLSGNSRYFPKLDNGMAIANGQVMAAPGYANANAGIKGAEAGAVEAAKYPYTVGADRAKQTTAASLDLVNVPMPDGSSRQMPRLQAAAAVGNSGGQAGLGISPSPVNQAAATGLNDNWIKNSYQTTIDAGKAASDISSSLQAIRNIDLNTGWGTEAKATAASVLTSLGIAPQNASMFAANSQKFQSVAMDRLMTTLGAQKGPQTEGDAQRASQTFAQLKNTPEANKFIVDFAQAKANQDMRKAQFYEQALPLAQKQGDLTRVDREWRKIQGSIWADPILQGWSK